MILVPPPASSPIAARRHAARLRQVAVPEGGRATGARRRRTAPPTERRSRCCGRPTLAGDVAHDGRELGSWPSGLLGRRRLPLRLRSRRGVATGVIDFIVQAAESGGYGVGPRARSGGRWWTGFGDVPAAAWGDEEFEETRDRPGDIIAVFEPTAG